MLLLGAFFVFGWDKLRNKGNYMANVTIMDFTPLHHSGYGIQHENIAKELTNNNWNKKAVIRDGNYLFLLRCRYWINEKVHYIFFIKGLPNNENVEFNNLNKALDFINNYSVNEGEYPEESEIKEEWRFFISIKPKKEDKTYRKFYNAMKNYLDKVLPKNKKLSIKDVERELSFLNKEKKDEPTLFEKMYL